MRGYEETDKKRMREALVTGKTIEIKAPLADFLEIKRTDALAKTRLVELEKFLGTQF